MNLDKLQEFLGVKVDPADGSGLASGFGTASNKPLNGTVAKLSDAAPSAIRAEMQTGASGGDNVVQPSVLERMQEIQMAQKLGYLICKCTWPPQVMTLSTSDFIYRCPRCSRVRDF